MKPARHAYLLTLFPLLFLCLLTGCGQSRADRLANAERLLENGDVDGAKRLYMSLLRFESIDPDAIQGMIEVTGQQKNALDEHQKWCEALLALRPWDRYANIVVGKKRMAEGNLKDAAARFLLALEDAEFKADREEALRLIEQAQIAMKKADQGQ